MDAKTQLTELHVLALTEFAPQQHVIHKPTMKGTGQALKIQLRMAPKWVPTADGGFFDKEANKAGGLFLELAPQGPMVNGNATFNWKDQSKLIRCKLGMADIIGLLAAIREYRVCRADVPSYLRSKSDPQPNAVSLFHKFAGSSTAITYTFGEESSILRISKSKDLARSISLHVGEELILQRMLDLALTAYLKVGKR